MRKIKTFFKNIFAPTKVIEFVRLDRFDNLYERLIASDRALKWGSFFIIILVYLGTELTPTVTFQYAEDVRGKTLTAIYDAETYLVEGLPKTVDFTIEGKESLVKTMVQNNTFNAFVDLTNLKPGQHIVKINYDVLPGSLDVSINPENVSIIIKEIISTTKDVEVSYTQQSLLDPTVVLGTPTLSKEQVVVKGPKDLINKLVSVQALVDVSSIDKLTDIKIPLYAIDQEGNKLDVSIEPSEITMTIPYDIPKKDVPIKMKVTGDLPEGKLIQSIKSSLPAVTVFAPHSALTQLNEINLEIPFEFLDEKGHGSLTITPPKGVTKLNDSRLEVEVTLADKKQKTLEDVPIGLQNLSADLKVKGTVKVDVNLIGLEEDLLDLDGKKLALTLDADGLEAGTYELPLKNLTNLEGSVKIETPKTVKITLVKK